MFDLSRPLCVFSGGTSAHDRPLLERRLKVDSYPCGGHRPGLILFTGTR